jgi:phosphate transport system substrate-binding protein
MKKESILSDRMHKAVKSFGIFGWLLGVLGIVILAGIMALVWLTWNFQIQSQSVASNDRGSVTTHGDFAIGRPKRDDILFRLAGSARTGEKLVAELAANWMRNNDFGGVTISKRDRIITVSGLKGTQSRRILIYLGSSAGGFEAMTENRIEGVVSDREIAPSEADRLSAYGDMYNAESEKVIAHDVSFAFVNKANGINSLNGDMLSRIMSGEIKDWSEVSPQESGKIEIYVEDLKGDRASSPLTKILGETEIVESAKLLETPEKTIAAVRSDAHGIGFSHREGNIGSVKEIAFHERNARIFNANEFEVATEAYPFTQRLYLYVPSAHGNAQLRSFADYVLSEAGQIVVRNQGFGAQVTQALLYAAPSDAPPEYRNFSQTSRRMNFDFRFQLGANSFDNKAYADLARFIIYLQKNDIGSNRVALFGFADNVGSRDTNFGLAQARAEAASTKLTQLGVNPALVRSFGDVMPVGANAYEAGRIKNRRVEVWICPPPACPLMHVATPTTNLQVAPHQQGIPSGVRLGRPAKAQEGEIPTKG